MAEKELDIIIKSQAQNLEAAQQMVAQIQGLGVEVDNAKVKTAGWNVTLQEHKAHASEAAKAEHLITAESRESAKAMGELGAKGGELFERFSALTTAAGGLAGTLTGGLLLGLGAVAEGVKRVNETYQEQQHAEESLKQAVQATASPYIDQAKLLGDVNQRFEEFANQNAQFIDNENSAKDALAAFIRAGFDTDTAMQALGVSLDLAGIKQESLTTAGQQVLLMMEGQGRVAKQLGIDIKALSADDVSATAAHKDFETATKAVATAQTQLEAAQKREQSAAEALKLKQDELAGAHKLTAAQADQLHMAEQRVTDTQNQVTDASDKLTKAQQELQGAQDKVNGSVSLGSQVMDQLKQKTDGGRQSIDQQKQSENELAHQWDIFAKDTGPAVNYAWLVILGTLESLLELINDIPGAVSAAINALGNLGTASNSAVARGRTAQYTQNVPGESGPPIPAGGGGGGGISTAALAGAGMNVTFNISHPDAQWIASAVDARLAQLLSST